MMSRTQITLSPETHRRARERADRLGISFAEYVRRLLERDLAEEPPSVEREVVFDLGRSEGGSVARDKDRMLGQALAGEHDRERSGG